MKFFVLIFFSTFLAFGNTKTESFVIQINDRSMNVFAPDTKRVHYAILVENRSLSDQVGKFIVDGKAIKFVSVKSGKTETVEIDNKTATNVVFIPISPAFQEVELIFGKKAYEIPPKE